MPMVRVTLLVCLASALAVSAQAPATPADVFFDRVRLTNDVSWLERVASSDALLRQEWTAAGARGAVSDELRIDMFMSTTRVDLRKINGRWVVVGYRLTGLT